MPIVPTCLRCSASEDIKKLRKCPICFRFVCEECCYFFAGRHFCNKGCADLFFFGTGDEEED